MGFTVDDDINTTDRSVMYSIDAKALGTIGDGERLS